MLHDIPTHLIAGSLGAGKTSLIQALLQQKPDSERWAVCINEFGQLGLDAALLEVDAHTQVAEIAGGCVCCIQGVPFQTGLNRLLRRAQPDRLLIEPSGLGHPLSLYQQLQQAPWQGVLRVLPPVLVVDALALMAGQDLPAEQQALLSLNPLILLNKTEALSEQQIENLSQAWSPLECYATHHAYLPLEKLPEFQPASALSVPSAVDTAAKSRPWQHLAIAECYTQQQQNAWSISWRWPAAQQFDVQRLQHWLEGLAWIRAKLIVHGLEDWYSVNAVAGSALSFQTSEWRRDSRIELIFAHAQDQELLSQTLEACRCP